MARGDNTSGWAGSTGASSIRGMLIFRWNSRPPALMHREAAPRHVTGTARWPAGPLTACPICRPVRRRPGFLARPELSPGSVEEESPAQPQSQLLNSALHGPIHIPLQFFLPVPANPPCLPDEISLESELLGYRT